MKRLWAAAWLVCMVSVLAGCGRSKHAGGDGETSHPDTLTDAAGRKVVLPKRIERVVSPFTMYTRLIIALGGCDKLAGISHTCVLPEEQHGCNGVLLDLPDVGPFGANMELIASLDPGLVFASRPDVSAFASKTNATVIGVSFPSDMPMLEIFDRQIDLIGTALRLQPQADSLKAFIDSMVDPVVAKTSAVPDSRRPRTYFAWTSWTGDILNTVCDFDPIELAGGVNVAGEARSFAKGERGILISREHLLQWNPDVIFVSRYQRQKWHDTGQTEPLPVTVEDVMADPLLQSVNAVQNGRVYYTTAFCNWWPHQRALVQILYMAKLFHPELFASLDVEQQGNRIFERFYGDSGLYTEMARDLQLHSWN